MAIDPDIQAFVDANDQCYPPDAASRALAEQRRLYDAYGLAFEPAESARSMQSAAPMLTLADVQAHRDLDLGEQDPEPGAFVLDAPALAAFPPSLLFAAEHDPLRNGCTVFARRFAEAGTRAHVGAGQGLLHGSLRVIERSAAARAAFVQVTLVLVSRMVQTSHPDARKAAR